MRVCVIAPHTHSSTPAQAPRFSLPSTRQRPRPRTAGHARSLPPHSAPKSAREGEERETGRRKKQNKKKKDESYGVGDLANAHTHTLPYAMLSLPAAAHVPPRARRHHTPLFKKKERRARASTADGARLVCGVAEDARWNEKEAQRLYPFCRSHDDVEIFTTAKTFKYKVG